MTEKAVEKFLVKLKFSPGNLIFGKNMGKVWHVHFFALLLGSWYTSARFKLITIPIWRQGRTLTFNASIC